MAASGARGKSGGRGTGGFQRASEIARPHMREAAAKYGFAEAQVLARWPEVVGEALSAICRPARVSYGRSRGLGATLVVEVEGARGPEVEMQAPRILERINSFYGYRAIARLRVTQTAAAGFAEERTAFAGPEAAGRDDSAAAERASTMAAGAGSPALRAALTRLGTYVLRQSQVPRA